MKKKIENLFKGILSYYKKSEKLMKSEIDMTPESHKELEKSSHKPSHSVNHQKLASE